MLGGRNVMQRIGGATVELFMILDGHQGRQLFRPSPSPRRTNPSTGPEHTALNPVQPPHGMGIALGVIVPTELKPTTRTRLEGRRCVLAQIRLGL